MLKKLWKQFVDLIRGNPLIVILVLASWVKLLRVDAIMFDDPKGLSVLFYIVLTSTSALLIYAWVFLLNRFRVGAALLVDTLFSLILWVDIVYFRYFGSLIKIETLSIVGQTTGVGDSVFTLLSPFDVLFFIDILAVGIYLLLRRKESRVPQETMHQRLSNMGIIVLACLLPVAAVFWRDRHEHLDRFIFHNYDINSIEFRYGAVAAHGINAFRSVLTSLEHLGEDDRETAIAWIRENAVGQQADEYTDKAKDKNIFLIQVESLQSFVVGRTYEGQEITPNLNRLVAGSYYLPNGYTATGGGLTSDSDFTANTSIHALRDASVFVQYGTDEFTSLPKALENSGYKTNAYHAYRRDFWNRGVALNSIGFDHFFARDEYIEDEIIGMGISDESFYRQTLEKLDTSDGPAFNFLISLTSHHPFIMDERYRMLKGEEAEADYKTYHYYQSIYYADKALGMFLDGLRAKGLYDDSLIVVYGDHTAKVGDYNDPKMAAMLGSFRPEEMNTNPYIYKLPQQKSGYRLSHPTSQLDIMPTILNLTGAETAYPMFGGNALTGKRKAVNSEEGIHYSDLMIRFNLFEEFNK